MVNWLTFSLRIRSQLQGVWSWWTILRAGYIPWDSVDFHGRAGYVEGLSKSYKAVSVASDVDTSSMRTVLQSPRKLAVQRCTPVQAPKIDLGKTSRADTASALVGKLCSPKKRSGDNE